MRNYVIINGVNSLTIQGLAIKTMPPITKPIQRTLREEIDGRDGDIVTTLGYGAYDKTIEIGLFGTFDIDEVIAYFNQKGTITFSNEADKVYYFEALDQVDYAELLKFRTANVVLHCQPFKYPTEETPLEEEYEYVEATGTNVTLDNTSEAIFNKIDLQGNTSQVTYTGKNKFDTTQITTTGIVEKLDTGFKMTCGLNGGGRTGPAWTNPLDAGLYKLISNLTKSSSSADLRMQVNYTNSTVSYYSVSNNVVNFGNVDKAIASIQFYFQNGTPNDEWAKLENLMIIKSTDSETPYEPYVGEIPSPNPNYPQDIHVVSGQNKITICGKNLANIDDILLNKSWQASTYNTRASIIGIPIQPNTKYTIAADWTSSDITQVRVVTYAGEAATTHTGVFTGTFTTPQAARLISIEVLSNSTITQEMLTGLRILLCLGEATMNDYEPYQGGTHILDLRGKNKFDCQMEQGTISGTDGTTYDSTLRIRSNKLIRLEANTSYTLSIEQNNKTGMVFFYGTNQNYIGRNSSSFGSLPLTFTTTQATEYIKIIIANSNGSTNITPSDVSQVQIEKGETKTTYEIPSTIEMASIPNTDYKDVFVKEGETWYKRGLFNKVTIDNSYSWTYYSTGNYFYNTSIIGNYPRSTSKKAVPFISNRFIDTRQINIQQAQDNILLLVNQPDRNSEVNLKMTSIGTNANDLKTWLGNNNVELRYLLAEAEDIEITNETLIGQLEAIKNAISRSGQTNVSQTNNDLPFVLDLSALKENSDHLVIDNTGNIYSKPTIELEGTGIVDIYLNDIQVFEVDLSEENKITIDTEKMEAYTDTGLANRKVTGDYSTFKLNVGTNDLRFSGALTSATITRYKRWL